MVVVLADDFQKFLAGLLQILGTGELDEVQVPEFAFGLGLADAPDEKHGFFGVEFGDLTSAPPIFPREKVKEVLKPEGIS